MMKFDNYFLEHSLMIFNFDLNSINVTDLQHVPIHEWKVATDEMSKLYIENLQCCIGLYAYGNGFAFGSHIDTVMYNNNEFILDKNKQPIFCNRCLDLLYNILKHSDKIFEPFKIGLAIGTPVNLTEKSMSVIYKSISILINRLKQLDIPVILLDDIYESELIIDAKNSCIIAPKKEYKMKN